MYDPLSSSERFGFAEIKCSYKYQDITTEQQASTNADFMIRKEADVRLVLKKMHIYFSQVQGQMEVGGRMWCDFIVYTRKGISVERSRLDQQLWESDLLPKLCNFIYV